jgi:hypothetical protein
VNWQKKHIKSIALNYSKAPFFKIYADEFFGILNRSWKYLIDLNLELIYWIVDKLNIATPMLLSSELNIPGSNEQRLIDIILSLNGNHFYEGSAGRNYIDRSVFEKTGISVTYQDYEHPVYPQRYGEFISHLSIIDLIFNCGTESINLLTHKKKMES